jgi:diguanylate cyclase (GGDEF)-like protein
MDPSDRRIRRSWWTLSGAFLLVAVVVLLRAFASGSTLADWLLLAVVLIAGGAALVHGSAVADLDARRRGEAESFARILSGLSRSVSPDAIVDAIAEELGLATASDHVVVVRRAEDGRELAAHLVSLRPGVPDHSTPLPIGDLEDPIKGRPASPAERADRIARRVRDVYGLGQVLAAPLATPDGVVGALVVSRRVGSAWPESTLRILGGAAVEASAALARAYSHRDAEARASTDALTGLPNRHYFDEYVGLLARRRRAGDAVGILMVDIDRFKALNDRHGHAVGDQALRWVARRLAAVGGGGEAFRYGGEEFAIVFPGATVAEARPHAEEVRKTISEDRFVLRGPGRPARRPKRANGGSATTRGSGTARVTVSVGLAATTARRRLPREVLAAADRALYRAKKAGRNRVVAAR